MLIRKGNNANANALYYLMKWRKRKNEKSDRYKDKNLSESEAAKEMGIDRSHLYRVLKAKQDPGRKFIEGALKVCDGYSLNDLFFLTTVGIKSTAQ